MLTPTMGMGWAMVSATPATSAMPATTATLAIPPTSPWATSPSATNPTATPTTPATTTTEARGRPRLSPSPGSPTAETSTPPTPHTPATHTLPDTADTLIHTDILMLTAFKLSFGIDIWLLTRRST